MKRIIWNIVVIIYVTMAIFVTVCLLNYNTHKITEFGNNTLLIISDDNLNPDYKNGDLVVINKSSLGNAKEGDKIFFYNNDSVKIGEINKINKYVGASTTFVLDGNFQLVEDDVIGMQSSAKVYGVVGKILGMLESKWGFLFLIIVPSLLAFLNEVVQVISELRGGEKYPERDSKEEIEE